MKKNSFLFFLFLGCLGSPETGERQATNSIEATKFEQIVSDDDKDSTYRDLDLALANKDCVKTLILSAKKYKTIPMDVVSFKNLEFLYLPDNQITFIPKELYILNNLKMLVLMDNKIEVIPSTICSLNSISILNFSRNPIAEIPTCIFEMKNLYYLGLETYNANPKELVQFKEMSKRYGAEILLSNGRIKNGDLIEQY